MRRLTLALRALLVLVAGFFILLLVIVNFMRMANEERFPDIAYLGMPVYVGVLLGFVPVFLGIGMVWRFAALLGQGVVRDPRVTLTLQRLKWCAAWVSAWFTLGVVMWGIVRRGMDPPFVTMWVLVHIPTAFVFLVSAIFEQLWREELGPEEHTAVSG